MSTHQPSPECKEIFAQLSAYLDLEIPPDACRQMEEHFKDCPPCIEFVESLRKTVALCKQYSPAEMPASMSEASRAALHAAYRKAMEGSQPL